MENIIKWLKPLLKTAAGIKLEKGVHSQTLQPIYFLTGDTYPVKSQIGRQGLGFTWYGIKKIWWLPVSRLNERIVAGLRQLGTDMSILQQQDSATQQPNTIPQQPANTPHAPVSNQTFQQPTQPKITPPTNRVDQTWDDSNDKSKWYGFPIKQGIYLEDKEFQMDGQPVIINLRLSRGGVTGRRKIPSYRVFLKYKDKSLGTMRLKNDKPWGTFDEYQVFLGIIPIIQKNLDEQKDVYKAIKNIDAEAQTTPELIEYMKQFDRHEGRPLIRNITLTDPKFAGEYPVKIETSKHGTISVETAIEHLKKHPHAPRDSYLAYWHKPPAVNTVEQFLQWIDQSLLEENSRIQKQYSQYLSSFAFKDEDVQIEKKQFDEVKGIIEYKLNDLDFFKKKLLSLGYIKPRRAKRTGIGMVPQESITMILNSNKIIQDVHKDHRLSSSPYFFFTAIAYMMHRLKAGNISFMPITLIDNIRYLSGSLKRYGLNISTQELDGYIENLASKLLQEITGEKARGTAWDNWQQFYGGKVDDTDDSAEIQYNNMPALNKFVQFAVNLGIDEERARVNPKSVFRELAMKFNTDINPTADPTILRDLNPIYEALPQELRAFTKTWLEKAAGI